MSDIARSPGASTGRRGDVLRVLQAAPAPMTVLEIADELGVHPNTARFHLDTLVASRRAELVEPERRGPGRPPLMFRAIRQMDRGGPRRYRLLAEILVTGLVADGDPAAKAQAAGRAWGERLESSPPPKALSAEESIDHLIVMLDGLGFAPERRGQHHVGLRHCPFLELAETRRSVVCPIHLGLMRGALEAWGSRVAVDRLDAFVEPDLCLAHLVEGVSR